VDSAGDLFGNSVRSSQFLGSMVRSHSCFELPCAATSWCHFKSKLYLELIGLWKLGDGEMYLHHARIELWHDWRPLASPILRVATLHPAGPHSRPRVNLSDDFVLVEMEVNCSYFAIVTQYSQGAISASNFWINLGSSLNLRSRPLLFIQIS
jgi:hypothetical protein